ncbi:hypothetical protein Ancab_038078 [Ancistrocladus abbreviatus]
MERTVRIWCQGITLQAWTEEVFRRIAIQWGIMLGQDSSTTNRDRFNYARLLISTLKEDRIGDSVVETKDGERTETLGSEESASDLGVRFKKTGEEHLVVLRNKHGVQPSSVTLNNESTNGEVAVKVTGGKCVVADAGGEDKANLKVCLAHV